MEISVGISNRHVHLRKEDFIKLFGEQCVLESIKPINQPGQFASNLCVTLKTEKDIIENVRILGPLRSYAQVEISKTDTFVLKVSPPVRPSGKIEGSEKLVLVGPKGVVYLKEGVIIANRHIHLTPEYAAQNGINDNDYVDVLVEGIKPTKFFDVQVRVRDDFNTEMHIDTDDANSAGLKNGDLVKILKK